MSKNRLRIIEINSDRSTSFTLADREARKAISPINSDLLLVGWWDRDHAVGGPVDVCGDENHACVSSYAHAHGASHRVIVNGGEYEFFYARTPVGTRTLDASAVAEVHQGLAVDQFENVQGG